MAEGASPTSDPMTGLHRLFEAVGRGEVDRICERLGVQLLGVFGSAAHRFRQGNPWPPPRDLDICVQFNGENHTLELLGELWRVTGYEPVDVAVLNDANPVLRAEALGGVGLYEQRRNQWAAAQMAAISERIDTAWLRRLDLELMAA